MVTYLYNTYSCFGTTTAKLSRCNKMVCSAKPKILITCSFTEKVPPLPVWPKAATLIFSLQDFELQICPVKHLLLLIPKFLL